MYVFEYQVEMRQPGESEYKPFTSAAIVSDKEDVREARIDALVGARRWTRNLLQTIAGTGADLLTHASVYGEGHVRTEVQCIVRHLDMAKLVVTHDEVGLIADQLGGSYVGSTWVEVNPVRSDLPEWMR